MSKSNPVHDLFKVPDSAIIKNQSLEIGVLKSEIEELKHNLSVVNKKVIKLRNLRKNSKNIQYIDSLVNKIEVSQNHSSKMAKERDFFKIKLMENKTEKEINEIYNELKNK